MLAEPVSEAGWSSLLGLSSFKLHLSCSPLWMIAKRLFNVQIFSTLFISRFPWLLGGCETAYRTPTLTPLLKEPNLSIQHPQTGSPWREEGT